MVGLRKVASGLDTGLVGMRGGGTRVIHVGNAAHDAPIHEDWGVGEDISVAVSAVKVG